MYIETSVRGFLNIFFRQQVKFFAVFGLVLLAGLFYLTGMHRVYEAHGSFLIKFGAGAVPDVSREAPAGGGDTPSEHAELIQSNIKILQSEGLLSAVIAKVGVERLYPGVTAGAADSKDTPEHMAIERLQSKDLKATTDSSSSLVDVSYANKDPQVAQEFVQTLMDMFIARQSEIFSAPQENFLQQQIAGAQQHLQDVKKKFQDFKEKTGIFNLDGEMTQLLSEKSTLSTAAFQALTVSEASLSKLEGDKAASAATYRPESPIMQRLSDSIAIAQAEVNKRQADLDTAGADNGALSPKISKINERMAYLDQQRGEYESLDQDVHLAEDNYKYYQQRSEGARGNALLNQQGITRIAVVDKPALPTRPEPLKRAMLLLAVLMTAALFGMGVVLFFELTSDSIAYPEQIPHAVGLPVLASFGRSGKP